MEVDGVTTLLAVMAVDGAAVTAADGVAVMVVDLRMAVAVMAVADTLPAHSGHGGGHHRG